MAIFQGAMIGIIGFLLMGYLFTFLETSAPAPDDGSIPVAGEPQTGSQEEASTPQFQKTYYTIQYGVFSTEEAAIHYLQELQIATAQLVHLDNYIFIWDSLSEQAETLVKKEGVQSFTKQLTLSASGCTKSTEFLATHLSKLEDQNFILSQINEAKFKSDEMTKLQSILTSLEGKSSKPLIALDSTLASEACIQIELK